MIEMNIPGEMLGGGDVLFETNEVELSPDKYGFVVTAEDKLGETKILCRGNLTVKNPNLKQRLQIIYKKLIGGR